MAFPRLIYCDFVLVIGLYWPAVAMFHLLLMESQTVLHDILQDNTGSMDVHGDTSRGFERLLVHSCSLFVYIFVLLLPYETFSQKWREMSLRYHQITSDPQFAMADLGFEHAVNGRMEQL